MSFWEWAQAALLAVILVGTTLLLGGFPPEVQTVTAVLVGVLVVIHAGSRVFERGALRLHPAGWLFVPFVVYAACNVIWITPVRWLGWLDWFGWTQMIAVFWVTLNGVRSNRPRQFLFFAVIGAALLGVFMACYQSFVAPEWLMIGRVHPSAYVGRASGPFRVPNHFAALLILLLPVTGALVGRRGARATERVWWGWVCVVLLLGLGLTISRGAWIALALALTVWPLAASRGSWVRRVGLAIAILMVVGLAGALVYRNSPAVRDRIIHLVLDAGEKTRPIMWRGAWQLFRDQPVTGTGAASYNVLFERHRPAGFRDEPKWAHNEFLNTLSDYGVVGFVLFFGPAAWLAWRSRRRHADTTTGRRGWLGARSTVVAFGIGLLAFGLHLGVEFHFKIPALALTFGALAGLAIGYAWPVTAVAAPESSGRRAVVGGIIVTAATSVVLVFMVPAWRSESYRMSAHRAIDRLALAGTDTAEYRAKLPGIQEALQRATDLNPVNGQAWSDLAYARSLQALIEPQRTAALGREAELAAEHALECSRMCSEFWVRRGITRDMQSRWQAAGEDFDAALRLAPADSMTWYYYADHLSRFGPALEVAQAAVDFCLRLDPGNSAGVALRQRLAIKAKAP